MQEHQIYLASRSPRRRELLEQIGVRHEILDVRIDERMRTCESPEDYVIRLALEKALTGQSLLDEARRAPVLGADTVVVLDGMIMGKPLDRDDALEMLEELSGHTHLVLTGMALADERVQTRLSVSHVTFRKTSAREREAYWASGEPVDKAGAYAIQGRGAIFIERLEGSYSGVMGLSLFDVAQMLEAAGVASW